MKCFFVKIGRWHQNSWTFRKVWLDGCTFLMHVLKGIHSPHFRGVNVQFSCRSVYNFTTFWGPTRLFPTKKCIVNQLQQSFQWLKMGYPSFEWKLWSTYFSPCFLWCFYIKVDFEDGWILKFPQIIWPDFTFLQIPNRPLILVGSGELSTEKLWSQVSEANLWEISIGFQGFMTHYDLTK